MSTEQILFLGSNGTLSVVLLRQLLEAGVSIRAVVVPRDSQRSIDNERAIPVYQPDDIESVCHSAGVPVETVRQRVDPALIERISDGKPDLVLCACFPYVLSSPVLELPVHGCLNLHPSLLPAYRGPAPLFWQLRAGERSSGITLHRMSITVDGGDIVSQSPVPISIGADAAEINRELAHAGARLVIEGLERGEWSGRSQNEADASYFSWPQPKDFELESSWSAERVFGFMRGTRGLGQRYPIGIGGERFSLEAALLYSKSDVIGKPYERFGSDIRIQLSPGVVHATVWPE